MGLLQKLPVLACLFSLAGEAYAQNAADGAVGYLQPGAVLDSSSSQFPKILESLAKRRSAQGTVTEADGEFDLVFESEGTSWVNGFYDGQVIESSVTQPLRWSGSRVFGSYKVSDGTFPIYQDKNYTNSFGEFRVGFLFSLLRDRAIDPRRFKVRDARLALEQADLEVLMTRVGVQHNALMAYWRWVAAGRRLVVYEDLLTFAEQRQDGLEEQVRSGAMAEIFLTENRQNISRRQRLATEAWRDFFAAGTDLGLYYRDESGKPLSPDVEDLPPSEFFRSLPAVKVTSDADIAARLSRRPELELLRRGMERAQQRIEYSRNALDPRLDLSAELARDVGRVAEGGFSRDQTEFVVGLKFSVPLQRTAARGQLEKAKAERDALMQQQRFLEDSIEIEFRKILVDLDVTVQLVDVAAQEVMQSEELRRAELQRFQSGASDFFLVNLREESEADARIRLYEATLRAQLARVNYAAATLDLNQLGLAAD